MGYRGLLTRHNGVLSLQDGLFAHLDLGFNSSCLVQGCLFPGRFVGLGSCFSCSGRRASVVVVCFSPYGVLVLDRLLLVCGALSGSVLAFKRPMLLFLWYGVFSSCVYPPRRGGSCVFSPSWAVLGGSSGGLSAPPSSGFLM